jgi:uncharacterized protein (TIGR03790 family)
MRLAASDVDAARRPIGRGVAADRTLGLRGVSAAQVHILTTSDRDRNVRARRYLPAGLQARAGIELNVQPACGWTDTRRAPLVQTGSMGLPTVKGIERLDGGLGDHLRSHGGRLRADHGQATALDRIASGVTASHGAVSELCNHLPKFPHPQWLLLHCLQGSTAIAACWNFVRWPRQLLLVGEPPAASFARR